MFYYATIVTPFVQILHCSPIITSLSPFLQWLNNANLSPEPDNTGTTNWAASSGKHFLGTDFVSFRTGDRVDTFGEGMLFRQFTKKNKIIMNQFMHQILIHVWNFLTSFFYCISSVLENIFNIFIGNPSLFLFYIVTNAVALGSESWSLGLQSTQSNKIIIKVHWIGYI